MEKIEECEKGDVKGDVERDLLGSVAPEAF